MLEAIGIAFRRLPRLILPFGRRQLPSPAIITTITEPLEPQEAPKLVIAKTLKVAKAQARRAKWQPKTEYSVDKVLELTKLNSLRNSPFIDQPVQLHAHRLLLWIDNNCGDELMAPPCASGRHVRGMFGFQLEEQYALMCLDLWWHPQRWDDRHGVAEHFRRLTRVKTRGYRYMDIDGARRRLVFYPVPLRSGFGSRLPARKATPEVTPRTEIREQLRRVA